MSETIDQKRMTEERAKKGLILPDKYLLLIKGPRRAIAVEGRKNFTEYNSREATITAWFQFMCKLAGCPAASKVNALFRMKIIKSVIKPPPDYYALIMEHVQEGLFMCFGGRATSMANIDSQEATLELIAYFEQINAIKDDELQGVLQEFGFGIYEL
jgi:hypothetical protein